MEKRDDRLFKTLKYTYAGLQGLDALTTLLASQHPGFKEKNPVMAPLVKSPPLFLGLKGLQTYLSLKALDKIHSQDEKLATILAGILAGLYAGINGRNIYLGFKYAW